MIEQKEIIVAVLAVSGALNDGTPCWCDFRISAPYMYDHSPECKELRRITVEFYEGITC